MSLRRRLTRALGSLLLLGGLLACDLPDSGVRTGQGEQSPVSIAVQDPASGLPAIAATDLPPEGRRTLGRIGAGGPFPYAKDGSVFGNREGLLPRRGGYREYTVPTPGENDRGARRIVCADRAPPDAECYYTADHYASFRRITP